MGSYLETLREVRRISAGGDPRRVRRKNIVRISAEWLGWKANAAVLRLLDKEVKK